MATNISVTLKLISGLKYSSALLDKMAHNVFVCVWCVCVCVCFLGFSRQGFFCVIVLTVLELALVDQAGFKLTGICLPLPPECSD